MFIFLFSLQCTHTFGLCVFVMSNPSKVIMPLEVLKLELGLMIRESRNRTGNVQQSVVIVTLSSSDQQASHGTLFLLSVLVDGKR